jgi:hypothetical protein
MSTNNSPKPVRPWDLLNKNKLRVEDAMQKERMSICATCPQLIQLTKQCKKCGCFMEAKTRLADASCPLHKWDAVDMRNVSYKDGEPDNDPK